MLQELMGPSSNDDTDRQGNHQPKVMDNRGQTAIDLLLAVTIFFSGVALLTVAQPGLFFPEDISETDETVTADTIANELINEELTKPGIAGLSHSEVDSFISNDENPSNLVSTADGQDILVTLTVPDVNNAPAAFESNTGPGNVETETNDDGENIYVVERGTDPSRLSTTVTRTTTLHEETVIVEVEVGAE